MGPEPIDASSTVPIIFPAKSLISQSILIYLLIKIKTSNLEYNNSNFLSNQKTAPEGK